MQYRNDINGLRAIAVIAVVIFHFHEPWMPGGFAGVDVFFVISGYLMTGIIFNGMEQGNFSILNFYVSRVNRIIPPLAVFCLFMLVVGYFFLTPSDYGVLGRDVATSMSFISSITFSLRDGYLDVADNFMLHTWSLSTEWQFYITYPVVLIIVFKLFAKETVKKLVLAGLLAGFFFSVYATSRWPIASYCLLPARFWEMLAGGVAFIYPLKLEEERKRYAEWLGLGLIVCSYLLVSEEMAWPGFLTLLPVFGAYLIIQAQRNNSLITGNVISQRLGSCSYSTYLWHWPVAVSFSYFAVDDKYSLSGALFSIALGFLSYRYIENKKIKIVKPMKIAGLYLAFAVFLVGVGFYVYQESPPMMAAALDTR